MILIKNGLVIDPASALEKQCDVLLEGAVISEIKEPGRISESKVSNVINAAGMWVTPGFIDIHCHLREPGFEWKETILSGAQAAALGGFTTICCMANTRPVNDCAEVARFITERGRNTGGARALPLGAVSIGLEGKKMAPYNELHEAGCVAFSDDGQPVHEAALLRRALEWCRMLSLPICCHEDDKSVAAGGCMNEAALSTRLGLKGIAAVAEDLMVARDIEIARATKGRIHFCHVSTARSVELIRRAKKDGVAVTAEVTPHHLLLTEELVGDYNTNAKMAPPLRQQSDLDALLEGLLDGTIDCIATDHAPHERDTKEVEFDKASFGIIGFQSALPMLLGLVRQGKVSRMKLVEWLTSAPARVFGFKDCGRLEKGLRADITLIRPGEQYQLDRARIRSLSCNTPFLGAGMTGVADTVIVGGEIVVENQKLTAVC